MADAVNKTFEARWLLTELHCRGWPSSHPRTFERAREFLEKVIADEALAMRKAGG